MPTSGTNLARMAGLELGPGWILEWDGLVDMLLVRSPDGGRYRVTRKLIEETDSVTTAVLITVRRALADNSRPPGSDDMAVSLRRQGRHLDLD